MGKPTICIAENKGGDQLRSNCEGDQHLCFCYTDSTIPLLLKSEISSFYTEQKKKCNNYISLNFEQTMIQLEIIAFSTSALDIRLPNARNRFSV